MDRITCTEGIIIATVYWLPYFFFGSWSAAISREETINFLHFRGGNYSREETIQERKLYEETWIMVADRFAASICTKQALSTRLQIDSYKHGNCGQIFPKIVHQKIIIVFEIQYSFCQTLNAIQINIKESKVFKRINFRLRWK